MSCAVWISGPPAPGRSPIARAAATRLRSQGETLVVLDLERVREAVAPPSAQASEGAVGRAVVYIAALLADSGLAVLVDGAGADGAWVDLARANVPRFVEARVEGAPETPAAEPEIRIDPARQSPAEAAASITSLVRTVSGRATPCPFPSRSLADETLRHRLLPENGSEGQKELSRRARLYAAQLLSEATAHRRAEADDVRERRERMVDTQIAGRGVRDSSVLRAMRQIPREAFVPAHLVRYAYEDEPLPIGEGQTISQPYVVAVMTEALRLRPRDRVLEVGTGSGYAAAVLSLIAAEVYTIERLARLAESARRRLADLGHTNVHVREGDGSLGWIEHAPYDAIVVTAGGPEVPPALLQQLAVGGRLVMPVGSTPRAQRLVRVVRAGPDRYDRESLEEVAFVPLIGAAGWPENA